MTGVPEAIAYLGLGTVRSVVLAAEVVDLFGAGSPAVIEAAQQVNDRSVTVAGLARALVDPRHAQDAFAAGLLHDIGWLMLAKVAPEQFLAIQEHQRQGVGTVDAEWDQWGASHDEVGACLLRLWGLPFPLLDAVARHHDPDAREDPDPVVVAVATAVAQADNHAD